MLKNLYRQGYLLHFYELRETMAFTCLKLAIRPMNKNLNLEGCLDSYRPWRHYDDVLFFLKLAFWVSFTLSRHQQIRYLHSEDAFGDINLLLSLQSLQYSLSIGDLHLMSLSFQLKRFILVLP